MSVTVSKSLPYHIGLRRTHSENGLPCPVQYITIAGVTFHEFTERVSGYGADTRRDRVQGCYVKLTDEQLQAVHGKLENLVVQFRSVDPATGKPKVVVDDSLDPPRAMVRARVMDKTVPGYLPRSSDMPLHGWLYMVQESAPGALAYEDPPSVAAAAPWGEPAKLEEQQQQDRRRKR